MFLALYESWQELGADDLTGDFGIEQLPRFTRYTGDEYVLCYLLQLHSVLFRIENTNQRWRWVTNALSDTVIRDQCSILCQKKKNPCSASVTNVLCQWQMFCVSVSHKCSMLCVSHNSSVTLHHFKELWFLRRWQVFHALRQWQVFRNMFCALRL